MSWWLAWWMPGKMDDWNLLNLLQVTKKDTGTKITNAVDILPCQVISRGVWTQRSSRCLSTISGVSNTQAIVICEWIKVCNWLNSWRYAVVAHNSNRVQSRSTVVVVHGGGWSIKGSKLAPASLYSSGFALNSVQVYSTRLSEVPRWSSALRFLQQRSATKRSLHK